MTSNAFLAVDLSDDERHMLSAALTEASSGDLIPGKRMHPHMWHITLRFLGECSDFQADSVVHNLSEIRDLERGKVWCTGIAAFPRASKAGVVYVALDDSQEVLAHLAGVCDEAATDSGFEPVGRPFVPHVTLSRLRPPRDVRLLVDSFGEFRTPLGVRTVSLMRSFGSRYETIDTLALA